MTTALGKKKLAGLLLILPLVFIPLSSKIVLAQPSSEIASLEAKKRTLGFIKEIPWALSGHWYSADTHTHTTYSRASYSIEKLARRAIENRCDVIAITDHAYAHLAAGSPDYFREIKAIDDRFGEITIIPGLEWNLPPHEGKEHATILFPRATDSLSFASEFRERFDHYAKSNRYLTSANSALIWLEDKYQASPVPPVVIYNHPSRKATDIDQRYEELASWRNINDLAIGFSGAPGHQKLRGPNNGGYTGKLQTEDRWDPVVARVGGVWDQLLRDGYNVWGARAPSDFHETKKDFLPCEFAETKIFARDASVNSILKAFRAGSFFAAHGKFVKSMHFSISAEALSRPALMGEVIALPKGAHFQINLEVELNERDWQGSQVHLDEVELITIDGSEISSLVFDATPYLREDLLSLHYDATLHSQPMIIRWRGRSRQHGEDYMFYSNPIRILPAD